MFEHVKDLLSESDLGLVRNGCQLQVASPSEGACMRSELRPVTGKAVLIFRKAKRCPHPRQVWQHSDSQQAHRGQPLGESEGGTGSSSRAQASRRPTSSWLACLWPRGWQRRCWLTPESWAWVGEA